MHAVCQSSVATASGQSRENIQQDSNTENNKYT